MRGFVAGFVGVLVVLLVAALVLPSFIDWNRYRDRLAAEVTAVTGRPLTMAGDLSLSLLPTPYFSAEDVSLANQPGGSDPVMARIEAVRINVSLLPLLSGTLAVRSVEIIRPDILLETGPDGHPNWRFGPLAAIGGATNGGATTPPPAAPTAPTLAEGSDLAISLDSLRITDGRVRYRPTDGEGGVTLEDIALTFSAESLSGPFAVKGEATFAGVGVRFQAGVGRMSAGGATQLAVHLGLAEGQAVAEFSGVLADLTAGPGLRGTLAVRADSLPRALAGLAPALGLDPADWADLPDRDAALDGTLSLTADQTGLEDLTLHLGDTEARGTLRLTLPGGGGPAPAEGPHLAATLAVARIAAEDWIAATRPRGDGPGDGTGATSSPGSSRDGGDRAADPVATVTAALGRVLASSLAADLSLEVEAVTLNGSAVRDLRLTASLADGRLSLEDLSARLPGVSDLAIRGDLRRVTAAPAPDPAPAPVPGTDQGPGSQADQTETGSVAADLTLSGASGDLRGLLDWLGVDPGGVPGDRLRSLRFSTTLAGTPGRVTITGLDLTLDTSHLRGALTLRPGSRLGVGMTVVVDAVNLDAYRPQTESPGPRPETGPETGGDAGAGTASAPDPAALLADLSWLNDLDASFDLAVGRLTVGGETLTDLALAGSLVRGGLTLTGGGYGRGPGETRLAVQGGVSGFGAAPLFHGLGLTLAVPDPARLARVLRLDPSLPLERMGPAQVAVTLDGRLDSLTIDSRNTLAGGDLWAAGTLSGLLAGVPDLDLSVDLAHPDAADLLARIAPDYRPTGPLGPLRLQAQVTGGLTGLHLTGLDTSLGAMDLGGRLSLVPPVAGHPLQATADLTATHLDLDALVPVAEESPAAGPGDQGRLWRREGSGPVPVAAGSPAGATGADRLSDRPLDLTFLDAAEVDLTLAAQTLRLAGQDLAQARVKARLGDGALVVSRLTGRLAGGDLSASGRVARGATVETPATYALSADVTGVRLADLPALAGAAGVLGRGDLTLDLTARGASPRAVVRSLSGRGRLTVTGLDVVSGGSAGGLGAVLGIVGQINRLAGLGGGRGAAGAQSADGSGEGLAMIAGDLTIDRGVIAFDPLTLSAPVYAGQMRGRLDLVEARVDAEGRVTLAEGRLSALIGRAVALPDGVPFSIHGSLADPVVTIATAALPQGLDTPGRGLDGVVREGMGRLIPGLGGREDGDTGGAATEGEAAGSAAPDTEGPAAESEAAAPGERRRPRLRDLVPAR